MDSLVDKEMNLGTELISALIKAQKEFPPVKRTLENPFFKAKYAPLEEINKTIDPILFENGLTVIQRVHIQDGVQTLQTVLLHESGQFITAEQFLNPVKQDPQGMGAAISYARRYGKSAILGLATEPDDDGNTASETQTQRPQNRTVPTPKQRQEQEAEDKETAATLNKEIHKLGGLVHKKHEELSEMAHSMFDVESMGDLTTKQQRLMLIDLYVEHLDMGKSVKTWWKKGAPEKENPEPKDVSENQQLAALKKLRKISVEREQEAA